MSDKILKRFIAFLLALTLLLSCAGAETAAIDELFRNQVKTYAFKSMFSFSVNGDSTSYLDDTTLNLLKMILPGVTGTLNYTQKNGAGEAQMELSFNERDIGDMTFRHDAGLYALTGSLLNDSSVWYTVPAAFRWEELIGSRNANQWPELWPVLVRAAAGDQVWKTRAESLLDRYNSRLSVLLTGYARAQSGRNEDGSTYTEFICSIPGDAVKTAVKQLLNDLYGDEDMMSLMREIMSAEEAGFYLNAENYPLLCGALDALYLNGNVEVVRRFDAAMRPVTDRVKLPFGSAQRISSLTISAQPGNENDTYLVRADLPDGAYVDFTYQAYRDGFLSGSVAYMLPRPENAGTEELLDDEETGLIYPSEDKWIFGSFDWSLDWEIGEETYTIANDRREKKKTYTLVIEPVESDFAPLSVRTEILYYGSSDPRKVAHMSVSLTLNDLDTGASLNATVLAKSATKWNTESLKGTENTLRVDQLSPESVSMIAQNWLSRIVTRFQTAVMDVFYGQ